MAFGSGSTNAAASNSAEVCPPVTTWIAERRALSTAAASGGSAVCGPNGFAAALAEELRARARGEHAERRRHSL